MTIYPKNRNRNTQGEYMNISPLKSNELEKLLGDDKWKYEKDRVENNAVPNHSVTPITSKPSEIKR